MRKIIPGGYALEMAIQWSAIQKNGETITPAMGNVFGAAINQHDNDGNQRRDATLQWAAELLDAVWNTPKYLGTVKFLADHRLQFIARNNITGVTNPVPYDGSDYNRTIIVDGLKDNFYKTLTGPDNGYLQLRSYAWNDNGKPDNDADLSAKVWTAWDSQWLYLYEEVKDNVLSGRSGSVWEEDCIELCLDPKPLSEANSVWQGRLTALGAGSAGVVAEDNLNNLADAQKKRARRSISGGYALEMAIQWSAIQYGAETITPAADVVFGAAINQHDNDGAGKRDATVQWAAELLNAVWNTPKYLGTVTLLADHKVRFTARSNITGVTNPVPYNGSNYTRTAVEEVTLAPDAFRLDQNYPNPFNPSTKISFSVSRQTDASLDIYDLLGRSVRKFSRMQCSPGNHEIVWDGLDGAGRSAGSGIYLFVLSEGTRTLSRKMIKLE